MTWKYFGRTGGTGAIRGIYRIPSEGYEGKFDLRHFDVMERLRQDGRWIVEPDLPENDWMKGWFNEADEITADDIEALVKKWNTEGWPGNRG